MSTPPAFRAPAGRPAIWSRLPGRPARLAVVVAGLIVLAEMLGGYWSSWGNLYDAAAAHGWSDPFLLPLLMDLPILAYVILVQVAVICLDTRALVLDAVALALAAGTVWANYAVGSGESHTWRVLHALMAAGWVLGIEALRWFWGRLRKDPGERPDRISLGRWLASPIETAGIQLRMWRLGERSWKRMSVIEDMRAVALDVVRELEAGGRTAPAHLAARIDAGRLPGAVLDAVDSALRYGSGTSAAEAAVRDWVAGQMVLREQAAASLDQARDEVRAAVAAAAAAMLPAAPEPQPAAAPEPPARAHPEPAPGRTRVPRPDAPPEAPRKPSPKACRDTPPDAFGELAGPWVAVQLEERPGLSVRALAAELKVGAPKARAALEAAREIAGREAVVVQLGARHEAGSR